MTTVPSAALPRFGAVWVTWRQHRFAIGCTAALLAVLAALLVFGGLDARSTFDQLGMDKCASFAPGTRCDRLSIEFNARYQTAHLLLIFLLVLPSAIGAFVGGPLIARELETGTFRFAWTQGAGRTRWLVTKLAVLSLALAVAGAAFGPAFQFWDGPFLRALPTGFGSYLEFEFGGLAFPAQTVLGFAVGVFAGVLARRVIVAIGSSFAATFGVMLLTVFVLRPHYMPAKTTIDKIGAHDWGVGKSYRGPSGAVVGAAEQHRLYVQFQAATDNRPNARFRDYLTERHYQIVTHYHPSGRFWPFQFIEAGWMLAAAVALGAATLWLVRRRTA
ncbi:ABC transporter permease [Actinomadura gamaensis]|uniref:ABC transporter permease n=1 Tax=Actinomadura gamaensis TaxID=1763541 RepID=A0ABV9U1T4_9ACTN